MKYALAIGYPLRLTAVGGQAVQEVELRNRRVALSLEQAMQWGALSVWRELGEAERPGAEELASLNVVVLGDSAEEILSALAPCIPLRQGFGLPMEEGTGIQLGEEQILLTGLQESLWLLADGRTTLEEALEQAGVRWREAGQEQQELILENLLGLAAAELYYFR